MNRLTDTLTVAALPLDIVWADKAANLSAVEAAMERLPYGTDVLVLPELFTTAYTDDPDLMRELAERNTGDTIERIRTLAARHGVAIAGSFAAWTPPHIYNRAFFIEPSGEETFYDKRHLFSLSSEAGIFTRGTSPIPVVRFRGWNIAMIVCYDLRFPVWSRCRHHGYDMLLVPSNWPQARQYAFEHLLIARAIENQCAVVGADRGGTDQYGCYDALTQIYDCYGKPVGSERDGFIVATLSRQAQDEYRRRFPAGNDADDFAILESNHF